MPPLIDRHHLCLNVCALVFNLDLKRKWNYFLFGTVKLTVKCFHFKKTGLTLACMSALSLIRSKLHWNDLIRNANLLCCWKSLDLNRVCIIDIFIFKIFKIIFGVSTLSTLRPRSDVSWSKMSLRGDGISKMPWEGRQGPVERKSTVNNWARRVKSYFKARDNNVLLLQHA